MLMGPWLHLQIPLVKLITSLPQPLQQRLQERLITSVSATRAFEVTTPK